MGLALKVLRSEAGHASGPHERRPLEGQSFRDIGRALDRSENAAQSLHAPALVQLGELFGR